METNDKIEGSALTHITDSTLLAAGQRAIEAEISELSNIDVQKDDSFAKACRLMLACSGRVIVMGIGKSGHIAAKIAATFASTGTAAFFVHPAEAGHGDLGMIRAGDVVLALSFSGGSSELTTLIPALNRMKVPIIGMTGRPTSILAINSSVHLWIPVTSEACPLGLAPTTSTTAMLLLGDALAIAMLEARGFTENDFAYSHPGGTLGRKLILTVADIMHQGDRLPQVQSTALMSEAVMEMTKKGLGMTAVLEGQTLLGIVTDGDLRRTFDNGLALADTPVRKIMTASCITVSANDLVSDTLFLMQKRSINGLLVVDDSNLLVGAFNMLDILKAGIL